MVAFPVESAASQTLLLCEPAPRAVRFLDRLRMEHSYILEFLDLRESPGTQERDLEQLIIDRIEDFLLELGKGFTFLMVALPRRILRFATRGAGFAPASRGRSASRSRVMTPTSTSCSTTASFAASCSSNSSSES